MPTPDDSRRHEINFTLLGELAKKPHPLLNMPDGQIYGALIDGQFNDCSGGVGEVMQEARNVHHLCDLAGIPQGHGYSSDIDARVYLLWLDTQRMGERLERIATWHSRQTGPGGTFDDYCIECGELWPCETRRMADGSHEDLVNQRSEETHA